MCLYPTGPDGLAPGTRCLQPFRPTHDLLRRAGMEMVERAEATQTVVVFATRVRAQTLGAVAEGLRVLAPGGRLVLDGAKGHGIDGVLRVLKSTLPLDGQAARDHGKVAWMTRPETLPERVATWAEDAAPHQDAHGLWRQAGMFSADGVDPGTALLSAHLPALAPKTMADFGAGWGALSLALAERYPDAQLDLIEADASALSLARRNLRAFAQARFHWCDVTALPEGLSGYDLIASNPPFHTTRKAEPRLGTAFIEAAARALSPRGTFAMVANRQLAYEATLDRTFAQWESVEQTPTYKIIHATRPQR